MTSDIIRAIGLGSVMAIDRLRIEPCIDNIFGVEPVASHVNTSIKAPKASNTSDGRARVRLAVREQNNQANFLDRFFTKHEGTYYLQEIFVDGVEYVIGVQDPTGPYFAAGSLLVFASEKIIPEGDYRARTISEYPQAVQVEYERCIRCIMDGFQAEVESGRLQHLGNLKVIATENDIAAISIGQDTSRTIMFPHTMIGIFAKDKTSTVHRGLKKEKGSERARLRMVSSAYKSEENPEGEIADVFHHLDYERMLLRVFIPHALKVFQEKYEVPPNLLGYITNTVRIRTSPPIGYSITFRQDTDDLTMAKILALHKDTYADLSQTLYLEFLDLLTTTMKPGKGNELLYRHILAQVANPIIGPSIRKIRDFDENNCMRVTFSPEFTSFAGPLEAGNVYLHRSPSHEALMTEMQKIRMQMRVCHSLDRVSQQAREMSTPVYNRNTDQTYANLMSAGD